MSLRSLLTRAALGALLAAPALAAPPPFEDSIAQRVQACTGCHGDQGRAGPDGFYPRLAGKPAGYLHHQLLNFRDGRRHYPLMTHLVAPLTDAYLLEMATYFSQLDVPYPPPAGQPPADVVARGESLVYRGDPMRDVPACVSCHGERLTGVAPAIPGLLGLPRDYLNAQFGAWRTGKRKAHGPDCMLEVAKRLDLTDINAVSSWLASRPVPVPAKADTSLPRPLPMPCGGVPQEAAK